MAAARRSARRAQRVRPSRSPTPRTSSRPRSAMNGEDVRDSESPSHAPPARNGGAMKDRRRDHWATLTATSRRASYRAPIDLPHPAAAQQGDDLIRTEAEPAGIVTHEAIPYTEQPGITAALRRLTGRLAQCTISACLSKPSPSISTHMRPSLAGSAPASRFPR